MDDEQLPLDEDVFTFDKFMDTILLDEHRVRQEHARIREETPQRRLNRRGRDAPANRTVYGNNAGRRN
jgi:hypothetical protein